MKVANSFEDARTEIAVHAQEATAGGSMVPWRTDPSTAWAATSGWALATNTDGTALVRTDRSLPLSPAKIVCS